MSVQIVINVRVTTDGEYVFSIPMAPVADKTVSQAASPRTSVLPEYSSVLTPGHSMPVAVLPQP